MVEKEIAVVILNYNGSSHLQKFLPSVMKFSASASVYVIDNASSDDSVEILKEKFTEVNVILNEKNFGFAEGYNNGLLKIKGNYPFFVLLNSDVEVTENWLENLKEIFKNDQEVVAVQPKILSFQNKASFEYAGAAGGFIDRYYYPFCRGRIFNEIELNLNQYESNTEVSWTSGAAMMVRSDVFLKMGGFDPDFFAHMEEIDWCLRAKSLGYKLLFCPDSTVYHLGGGTLSYDSPLKTYLNFRNNLTLIIKNHQGYLFPILFLRLSLDGLAAISFLFSGKPKLLFSVFKAHMYTYRNLFKTLTKRKKIKNQHNHSLLKFNGSILWNYYVLKNRKYTLLNKRRFEL